MRSFCMLVLCVGLMGCGAVQSRTSTVAEPAPAPEPVYTEAGSIELLLAPGWSLTKAESRTMGENVPSVVEMVQIDNGHGAKLVLTWVRDDADMTRFAFNMMYLGMSVMGTLVREFHGEGGGSIPPEISGSMSEAERANLERVLRETDRIELGDITAPAELLFEQSFVFDQFYHDGRVIQSQCWTVFDDDQNPRMLFIANGTWPQAEAEARRAEVMDMARSVRLRGGPAAAPATE